MIYRSISIYFYNFSIFEAILVFQSGFFFLNLIRSNNIKLVNLIQQNPNLINFQKYLIEIGNKLKNIFGQSEVINIFAFLSSNHLGIQFSYLYANHGDKTLSNRFLRIAGQSPRHTGKTKTISSDSFTFSWCESTIEGALSAVVSK